MMEATACYGGIVEIGKLRSHDVLHPGRFGSAPLHEPEHLSVGINGRKSTSLTDATSPWMVAVSKREGDNTASKNPGGCLSTETSESNACQEQVN